VRRVGGVLWHRRKACLAASTAWPLTLHALVKNFFQWHIPSLWAELHSGAGLHTVEMIKLEKIVARSFK